MSYHQPKVLHLQYKIKKQGERKNFHSWQSPLKAYYKATQRPLWYDEENHFDSAINSRRDSLQQGFKNQPLLKQLRQEALVLRFQRIFNYGWNKTVYKKYGLQSLHISGKAGTGKTKLAGHTVKYGRSGTE